MAAGLPVVPKVEFNFKVILYIITIYIFSSPGSCFTFMTTKKSLTSKHTDHHVFVAVEGRKNSSPEMFEDTVHLNIP